MGASLLLNEVAGSAARRAFWEPPNGTLAVWAIALDGVSLRVHVLAAANLAQPHVARIGEFASAILAPNKIGLDWETHTIGVSERVRSSAMQRCHASAQVTSKADAIMMSSPPSSAGPQFSFSSHVP